MLNDTRRSERKLRYDIDAKLIHRRERQLIFERLFEYRSRYGRVPLGIARNTNLSDAVLHQTAIAEQGDCVPIRSGGFLGIPADEKKLGYLGEPAGPVQKLRKFLSRFYMTGG